MKFCVVTLLLSLGLATGCGKQTSVSAPPVAGGRQITVDVDQNNTSKATVTTLDKDGRPVTTIRQPTPPDNYPDDLPQYSEGMDPVYLTSGTVLAAEWHAGRPPAEVAQYFERELTSRGWRASQTTKDDKSIIIKADKDGRQVEVRIVPDVAEGNQHSQVLLSYNPPA